MTLVQLRYLVALDTWRNFRKAAAECGVAQPSLSAQLNRLERELGVRLIDRTTKPVTPTPDGARVIEQARAILAEVAKVETLIDGEMTTPVGHIRVGIVPQLAVYLMPLIVPGLAQRYPEVRFTFEEKATPDLVAALQRDALDIGVSDRVPEARGVGTRILFEEPLVSYVGTKHRLFARPTLRVEDLSADDYWFSTDDAIAAALHMPHRSSTSTTVQYASRSIETRKRLVEQGEGMTVVSLLAVRPPAAFQPALIRPFAPTPLTRTVHALHAQKSLKPERIATFISIVQQAVGTLEVVLPA